MIRPWSSPFKLAGFFRARGDGTVFLHGSAVAGRGGTVTRALAVADAHSGPAVAQRVGVLRHEDASRRSDLGGAKDE